MPRTSSTDQPTERVTVTFQSGQTRDVRASIKDKIVGLDPEGRIVIDAAPDFYFGLTLCCDASDKGVEDGVVCRACYGTAPNADIGQYYFHDPKNGRKQAPADPIVKDTP